MPSVIIFLIAIYGVIQYWYIVVPLIVIILWLWARARKAKVKEQQDLYTSSYQSYSRTSYSSSLSASYSSHYSFNSDGRRINGHAVQNSDELSRWGILKGYAEGLERHLHELEDMIVSPTSLDAKERLAEWHEYYSKYRAVCLENGIWNSFVNDHAPFTASSAQLRLEETAKSEIQRKFEQAEAARAAVKPYQDEILRYIYVQYKRTADRYTMLNDIAGRMGIEYNALMKIYKQMVKGRLLSEKKVNNRYQVKKARRSASRRKLPPSVYIPENYDRVDKRMLYKIEYTVAQPENVNAVDNTCEFVSKSSGERYCTSLQKCTCPAYSSPKYPCKHMVALAIYQGYYHPPVTFNWAYPKRT